MKKVEGILNVPGGNIWYEIVGESEAIPLVTLHGGPGYPHDSLESLADLANERQVIFYDQLGCGNSRRSTNKSFWTVEHYVQELQLVIKSLKFKKYHVLGHSWGAALGAAFALTKPRGLQKLILADPYLGTPQWEKDAKRLLSEMPRAMQHALNTNKTKSKPFRKARDVYYYDHVYRMKELPVANMRASNKMNRDLYNYMWGPAEFEANGTLKSFDLVPRLGEITIPVLLMSGRFDEATPEALAIYKSLLPNAQMKIFEKSAHMPHWTERNSYIVTVRKFLKAL